MKLVYLLLLTVLSTFQVTAQAGVGIGANGDIQTNGNILLDGNILLGGQSGSPGQVLGTDSSGATSWIDLNRFSNVNSFTAGTDATWNVPAGVSLIYVELVGGGGGASHSSGGGGGSFESFYAQVSQGDVLTFTVGGGGAAATSTENSGTSGGTTVATINSISVAASGGGGASGGANGRPGSGGYNTIAPSSFTAIGGSGTTNKTYYSYGPGGDTVLTTEYGKGGGTYPHYIQNEGGFKSENITAVSTLRSVNAPYSSSFGSGGASGPVLVTSNNGEVGIIRIYY